MPQELTVDSRVMKKANLFRLMYESVAALTKSYKHRQMASVDAAEGQHASRSGRGDDTPSRAGCVDWATSSPRCWFRCGDSGTEGRNRPLNIAALLPSWVTWRQGQKEAEGKRSSQKEVREGDGKCHERKENPTGRGLRSCKRDERHGKEAKNRISILRPPIRQQYQRGVSGLPVRCGACSGWRSDWNLWVNRVVLV